MKAKFPFLNIKQKPFELFGIFALILLIFFLIPFKQVLTINLHDNYFVIAIGYLFLTCAVLCLFIWILYTLLRNFLLSNRLTWIHTIITIAAIAYILMIVFIDKFQEAPPERYYTSDTISSNGFLLDPATLFPVFVVILLLIAQLLFLINIGAGLIRRALRRA